MQHFLQFLAEAESRGQLEIVTTPLDTARTYATTVCLAHGTTIDAELPRFDSHYTTAQGRAMHGTTRRENMPVIDEGDVAALKRRLEAGALDVAAPYDTEDEGNAGPFPQGLSGAQAADWLTYGLPLHDHGPSQDDYIPVTNVSVSCGRLIPIQRQIYFDKSMNVIAQLGARTMMSRLLGLRFILSSDHHIIDGHHRWLSAMLVDPDTSVNGVQIGLPFSTLLPLALSYSDALGHERNA